jgi:hypothetical protein
VRDERLQPLLCPPADPRILARSRPSSSYLVDNHQEIADLDPEIRANSPAAWPLSFMT